MLRFLKRIRELERKVETLENSKRSIAARCQAIEDCLHVQNNAIMDCSQSNIEVIDGFNDLISDLIEAGVLEEVPDHNTGNGGGELC